MSYDIRLTIDTGGSEPATVWDGWNYTSNIAPMWRHAGADLAEFHGKKAGECAPLLAAAIERMEADPETYLAMNPPNGWGSYEGLLRALRDLLAALRAHSETIGRRCNQPANHPQPCRCRCGATTTREQR